LEEYISVGRVLKSFGTEGWMSVLIYSELSNRLDEVKVVFFKGQAGIDGYILSDVVLGQRNVRIKLKDVSSKENAQLFVGKEILLPFSQKIKLPDDVFFVDDLVGLEVYKENNLFIGILEEVWEMGGSDIYVVREAGKEILIPAVAEFVKQVDLKNRRIFVSLWEGM
jgi:16S rRNA processing protein RimM